MCLYDIHSLPFNDVKAKIRMKSFEDISFFSKKFIHLGICSKLSLNT